MKFICSFLAFLAVSSLALPVEDFGDDSIFLGHARDLDTSMEKGILSVDTYNTVKSGSRVCLQLDRELMRVLQM